MAAGENSASASSQSTRLFVFLVTAAGVAVLVSIAARLTPSVPPIQWVLLLALTAFSETFGIKLPSLHARLTVSESFVFTSIFLLGTGPSVLLVLIDGLLVPMWQRRRQNVDHFLFNTFEPVLSVWIASEAFFTVSGLQPLSQAPAEMIAFMGPALLVPILYFLSNSSLTAVAMALEAGRPPLVIWRQHSGWLSINCLVAVSIAGLLVQNPQLFLSSFAMSLPVLLISYFVFRSSIGRVEDAQRHVEDQRRLYLSTVETLAIAVDAKDQVTHGHIRRVQHFALHLAKALGVHDESSLRAIEAAGLLHDIGKLAIPDHILNKPGKLTAAEFERMKLHAEAGAEILSAVDFPFPVVPIVRHHHENWDGSGYPSGLAGDAIPLGARILAVVDCFDALTSDRPYRRALTAEQALQVLRERRATMYDPDVLDMFMLMYRDIANRDVLPATQPHVLVEIARSSGRPSIGEPSADLSRRSSDGAKTGVEVTTLGVDAHAIAERAALALEALLPVSMVAVYEYAPARDEVVLVYQSGGTVALTGCRLPMGRTVTGWAAANRAAVVNGDPSLDFAAVSDAGCEAMRSCLAVPLTAGDRLLGVLTLYSDRERAFDALARRVVESFAPYLAMWIDLSDRGASRSSRALIDSLRANEPVRPVLRAQILHTHDAARARRVHKLIAAHHNSDM